MRNAFARSLAGKISPTLNSWSRFTFNLPFSLPLTLVAYAKAVGQVEAIFAIGLALVVWREREVVRQLPGVLLILVGIALVLLG